MSANRPTQFRQALDAIHRRWESSTLEMGIHDVVIRNTSTARIDLDAIRVMAPLPVGVHQETDDRITYTGIWADYLGSGPSGDTMKVTSDPAATVSFQFEGNKLVLYRPIGPAQGTMEVCIDGACEPVDNSAASLQWAQPWVKTDLSGGVHDVALHNTGGGAIGFDAAKVTGSFAWNYKYDGLSRLTEACAYWDDDAKVCKGDKFIYSYDAAGNLLAFTRAAGDAVQPETIIFDVDPATNQVQCADTDGVSGCDVHYIYDTLGNLTSDGVTAYTYDTANRLVQVIGPAGTTRYEYNGDGDRIAETHSSERTEFTLDVAAGLNQVLAETTTNAQGTSTTTYLYGLGLVAQSSIVNQQSSMEYLLSDALGSVRQSVDTSGQVLLSQTFEPYGNLYEQSDGTPPSFGWTGQQSDPNGLNYLRARYYQPSMGRFTQLDPFAGALALPASMNGYGYAHGSPTMYTDPSGEFPILIALAIIGAAAFGGAAYGYQVHSNMQQGMDFWNAAYFRNINWGTVGIAAAVGAVAVPALYLGLHALPGIAGQVLGQAATWETLGGGGVSGLVGEAFLEFSVATAHGFNFAGQALGAYLAFDAVDDSLAYLWALTGNPAALEQIAIMSMFGPLDGPNLAFALLAGGGRFLRHGLNFSVDDLNMRGIHPEDNYDECI